MIDWIKGLFSLEERKASTVMMAFIFFCGVGAYMIKINGDIPSNITTILLTFGGIVGGVNSLPNIANIITASKGQNNPYGMNGYNTYSSYGGYVNYQDTTTSTNNNPV